MQKLQLFLTIMKARAWFSMLLICLIGFTGFGMSTSDLTKNSTTMTINDFDEVVSPVMVIVAVNPEFNINETNSYVYSQSLSIESELFEIKELLKFEKPIKELVLIPPLNNHLKIFNIKTSPKLKRDKYLLTYRRARDGINCNLS
jgi:hypothetical protein